MEEKILEKIKEYNMVDSYILAYFYNKVCVGIYKDGKILFNRSVNYKLLIQIRVFNNDKEIRFVLNEETGEFEFFVIDDNDGNVGTFEEEMFISGNKIVRTNDNFTTIKQSGGEIDIPFKINEEDIKKGLRLVVKNYFGIDSNDQVIIEKARLVDIKR